MVKKHGADPVMPEHFICGAKWDETKLASKPKRISCRTCRAYVDRHPELYQPKEPANA